MSTTLASQNPLSYMGVKPPFPPNVLKNNLMPTTLDTNYDLGTIWVDTTAIMIYMLADVSGNVATWIPLGGGVVDVQSLEGNSGGLVFPTGGTIDVVGDNASGIDVIGNPGTSTLTIFNTTGLPFSQIEVDANTPPGTDPVLPTAGGAVTITGGQIAAGSTVNVIQTNSLAANAFTIEIQRSEAQAVPTVGSNGVCHFNSADFTVDADGFVSIASSGMTWIDEGTGITLTENNGYFITAAVTETLPAAPSQGDTIKIICDHAGPIVITANAGQTISLGNISSSVAATFTNTALGDSLELFFRAATSEWKALNSVGTWVAA